MKKIFKVELKMDDSQEILMPNGAQFLSVQIQYNTICIWALVDLALEVKKYKILKFGTGFDIDPSLIMTFIGTVQYGPTVWHFFHQLK